MNNIEQRSIKFYLNDKHNRYEKDRLIKLLKECQSVENYLLNYYWNSFEVIIKTNNKIDMNYNNEINFKDTTPILKSHHFYTVLRQTYEQLKSIESNIIGKMRFKLEDKEQQRIYNYCKGFCFRWDKLLKSVNKNIKENKSNSEYKLFLNKVKSIIENEDAFNVLKTDIENKFWEIKNVFKTPVKKELQIWVDTRLSAECKVEELEYIFMIDNNEKITKRNYDTIVVPIKISDYHNKILEGKKLKNSFNVRLAKNGRLEITVVFEEIIEYPECSFSETIGLDIGLNKLITTSDGEIIEQNKKAIDKAHKLVKKQANRSSLEEHLKKKYKNEDFKLGDKRYLKQQSKLSDFVKTDNRHKVKNFLKDRKDYQIVIEDLKIGYSKTHSRIANYLLRRLEIQNIKNDLIEYGKKLGVKISLANPSFTSQTCSSCGNISKDNRKSQEEFICVKCGFTLNADINASINIRDRYFDDRIKLKTPYWKVAQILNVE